VVAKRLIRMGFELIQHGDYELTFIFAPDRFEELAAIVLPRRRPQRSPEQIEEATKRLAAWNAARNRSLEERQGFPDSKAG
jgi:hypothetical protein